METSRAPSNIAVVALIEKDGWRVGLATRDEPGYYPMNYGPFASQQEANEFADNANEQLGHSPKEALDILCSSMWPEYPMAPKTGTTE